MSIKKDYPTCITKRKLVSLLRLSYTYELRDKVITDDFLKSIGLDYKKDYKTKRLLNARTTKLIIDKLKSDGLL